MSRDLARILLLTLVPLQSQPIAQVVAQLGKITTRSWCLARISINLLWTALEVSSPIALSTVWSLAGRDADAVFLGRSKTQKNAVFLERPPKKRKKRRRLIILFDRYC